MRKKPACGWTLAAVLLAGCCLHAGREPNFCGGTTCSERLHWTPRGPNFASRLSRNVREKRRQAPDRNADGEARRLTAQITKADSASELLALLDKPVANEKLFNDFHMSAALTRLSRFKKMRQVRQSDLTSPVWAKLTARLYDLLREDLLPPRGAANVLYAVGELYREIEKHMSQVQPKLCEAILKKAPEMNAQDLANSLLAAAKLQSVSPRVLTAVPALAKHVPGKVKDMKPQELSNSLWAAAKLQDASPEVLTAVPALANCTPQKVEGMISQGLSNCLWAAAMLQDASPQVLTAVPALAKRIPEKVGEMVPQASSNCLLAAAKLQDSVPQVLEIVPSTVRRMRDTVGIMNEQDVSNNFWAVAMLKDASPEVLVLREDLVSRISCEIKRLALKGLQMSLWAAQQFGEKELGTRLQAELCRRKR